MKTATLAFVFILASFASNAQETSGVSIKVTIDNVSSNEGKVMVGLHSQDTFMKGLGLQSLESTIEDGSVSFTFSNVAPGTYAIMALHDVNENKRMDFDANGRPQESYGMSGNNMSFGPPVFENAQFEVKEKDLEFEIRF